MQHWITSQSLHSLLLYTRALLYKGFSLILTVDSWTDLQKCPLFKESVYWAWHKNAGLTFPFPCLDFRIDRNPHLCFIQQSVFTTRCSRSSWPQFVKIFNTSQKCGIASCGTFRWLPEEYSTCFWMAFRVFMLLHCRKSSLQIDVILYEKSDLWRTKRCTMVQPDWQLKGQKETKRPLSNS